MGELREFDLCKCLGHDEVSRSLTAAVTLLTQKWVAERKGEDPEYFDKLGAPQKPNFFYIGCSDSRVPANEIMGMGPGQSRRRFI